VHQIMTVDGSLYIMARQYFSRTIWEQNITYLFTFMDERFTLVNGCIIKMFLEPTLSSQVLSTFGLEHLGTL
jgi:hypothetical protein